MSNLLLRPGQIQLPNTRPATQTQIPPILAEPPVMGDTKREGTSQTYGQMYNVQSYDEAGNVVRRMISLSELQGQKVNFDPLAAKNAIPNTSLTEEATLLRGATFTDDQVERTIKESLKVDYFMCLKSQESLPLEFNNLQTPDLVAEHIYNFYTSDESNIDIQEDPTKDPFVLNKEIPRYVKLNWNPVDTINGTTDFAARTPEENAMVKLYLKDFRGTAALGQLNTARSFMDGMARTTSLKRDGKPLELVDTHNLPMAFANTSNEKVFKNSALTVLNLNSVDLDRINLDDLILDKF